MATRIMTSRDGSDIQKKMDSLHNANDTVKLSISAKLRTQIIDMAKDSMNAKDAMSFLQTAENGMEVIGELLQQMRKLAVEMSYEEHDIEKRYEVQSELDHLKSEIDTIVEHTEFKTKKILNGGAAGEWTSTSPLVEAIFRGSPVQGDYRLEFNAVPGKNAVYKSNIIFSNRVVNSALPFGEPIDLMLKKIPRFRTDSGRNILDSTQNLIIYGNNRQTVIPLNGDDTLKHFINNLGIAVGNDLGMGAEGVANSYLAQIVPAGKDGFASMGLIILQSAITGLQSELKFAGNEDVLDALGLSIIQHPVDSEITVNVWEARTGKMLGYDTVTNGMLCGLLDGTDIKFDSRVAINAFFDERTHRMMFDPYTSTDAVYINIVNRRTDVQVGADIDPHLSISLGSMNTSALDIANTYVMTSNDAGRAIPKYDLAITHVARARTYVGVQMQRLNLSMSDKKSGKQRLSNAKTGIKNLNMASASMVSTHDPEFLNSTISVLSKAGSPERSMKNISNRN